VNTALIHALDLSQRLGLHVHPNWWIELEYDEENDVTSPVCACGTSCGDSAGKHPIVNFTTESTTDRATIEAWWRQWPEANLGVRTDGITVVDVDPRNGGFQTYARLEVDLSKTMRVKTGGGGWHDYYLGEMPTGGGKLGQGIDFKSGSHAQVVGPGSEHWSGSFYEVAAERPLAALPVRALELGGRKAAPSSTGGVSPGRKAGPGERNDYLKTKAAQLRNFIDDEAAFHGTMQMIGERECDPPADTERVTEIAANAWRREGGWGVSADDAALMASFVRDDGSYAFDTDENLVAVFDGSYEPPVPTIMARTDGQCLFYPAAINLVFGVDSIGKTWISLVAAAEVLAAGGKVVHLDWDDALESNAWRLKQLGTTYEQVMHGYRHKTNPGGISPEHAAAIYAEKADLIIVDVVANALAAAELNENWAGDYLKWAATTAIPWAREGAAVILNDHTGKAESTDGQSRGSSAKRAGVDGAAYEVTADPPMMKGRGGNLVMTVTKDRHAGVRARGERVAAVEFDPQLGYRVVAFEGSAAEESRIDEDCYNAVVAVRALEQRGVRCTATNVRAEMNGSRKAEALKVAVDTGVVYTHDETTSRGGTAAKIHEVRDAHPKVVVLDLIAAPRGELPE
jgi:hypothetical protein